MYARVVQWQGGDAAAIRDTAADIASRTASGPPEGVPAVGFTLLVDPEGGRAVAISLFATEEDRREGDATLQAMNPPGAGMGTRGPVEFFEVAADTRT